MKGAREMSKQTYWPLKRAIHAAARQASLDGVDMKTIAYTVEATAFFARNIAEYGAKDYPIIERPTAGMEWIEHAARLS
jgi:hypothetical protein